METILSRSKLTAYRAFGYGDGLAKYQSAVR